MLSNTPRTFVGSTTFSVSGMTCDHCRRAVTEEISAVAGVESVTVDLPTGTVTVAATVGVLAALFVLTALAVPGGRPTAGAAGHGHGAHGHGAHAHSAHGH